MSKISIHPLDYLSRYSHWDMLIQYLTDYAARYSFRTDLSKEDSLRFLKDLVRSSYKDAVTFDGYNPGNLLKKGLENLASGKSLVLGRENLLRLILALGINDLQEHGTSTALQEADHFLLDYMHDSELSARNLKECIFIWSIHNNLSTKDIVNLIRRYKDPISNQPLSPECEDLYEGGTAEVLGLLVQIRTKEQLHSFIRENMDFFTKLGNTHYCSMFNDVSLIPYPREGVRTYTMAEYILDDPDEKKPSLIPAFLLARSQSDIRQREIYYGRLFGLYSLDEEEFENHLNTRTISKLAKILPDVFMEMDPFTDLIRRKTEADVPYGVHLLHMLVDLPPEDYVPIHAEEIDPDTGRIIPVDPVKAFTQVCNAYLNNAGFASLNRKVPIDRMVSDVYAYTIAVRKEEEYKDLFLYHFRKVLQEIADSVR